MKYNLTKREHELSQDYLRQRANEISAHAEEINQVVHTIAYLQRNGLSDCEHNRVSAEQQLSLLGSIAFNITQLVEDMKKEVLYGTDKEKTSEV